MERTEGSSQRDSEVVVWNLKSSSKLMMTGWLDGWMDGWMTGKWFYTLLNNFILPPCYTTVKKKLRKKLK